MTTLTQESATVTSTAARPRKKIATVPVKFLKYNDSSLNQRIYPQATCDAIYKSGLRKLADSNALPMTVFVSHEAANGNINTELVGKISRIWQEGNIFHADLDFADTRTSWDMLGLIENDCMRSISMRVSGVELTHDSHYNMPIVIPQEGYEPELMGIDLTTRPGLADTARIQQVLYESQGAVSNTYTEAFTIIEPLTIESKVEETPPMPTLKEIQDKMQQGTGGQSLPDYPEVSLNWHKKVSSAIPMPLYMQIILGFQQEAATADRAALSTIHDHLASVLDEALNMPSGESVNGHHTPAQLTEEGRVIAKKHATTLAAAHDASAKQCGLDCEGVYNAALGIPLDPDQDPDGDGIPDAVDPNDQAQEDGEESTRHDTTKGETIMTPEQMIEALKAQGFDIKPPVTAEEKLAAQEAKLAALEAKLTTLAESATTTATQRQTQAVTSMDETLAEEPIYQEGDYLAGELAPKYWKSLANRRVPWPAGMHPEVALHELTPFLAHSLLEREYAASGRSMSDAIRPYEQI